ncbi:acyl-CoA dehydrogenase family protein [Planobispora longispora]|uniref:Acyl-CoA dehydrogenase n=1 Tax=Planobispora longispora TaxID=28887 RepID=A0A8J3RPR0_9ACTN|nr:acyl-CoA dehydrogenase family protein [Planobispora longispora]BFE82737.1 acyl-CoA dehydrogenase family protein [Planobispora longispora]GIH77976.1 acyl-CoA dehydrogenase [Planobispora longispora]
MTLLYTEVEEELRASVRDLLADRCGPDAVLKRIESDAPYDMDLWKTLAHQIGVAGLLVPEEYGGAGATAREVAVVLEELGRAVAPVPFLTSAVLATKALLEVGEEDLVRELASGDVTAALAVPLSASPYRPLPETVTVGEDGTLSGQVRAVAGADVADVLLVPVGAELYRVAAEHARVEVVPSLDLTRPIATVTFAGAPATALGRFDARRVLAFGAGLLASEQLGVAEWCLDTTLAYIKERHQFARPIGSFQAIKHRMADLWLDVVRARAAARNAADLLAASSAPASDPPAPSGASGGAGADAELAAAVAAAWCSEATLHVAEESVQLHGGIGMTWEHPVHLYLKRAKAAQIALGAPGAHEDAVAELADLPGPV